MLPLEEMRKRGVCRCRACKKLFERQPDENDCDTILCRTCGINHFIEWAKVNEKEAERYSGFSDDEQNHAEKYRSLALECDEWDADLASAKMKQHEMAAENFRRKALICRNEAEVCIGKVKEYEAKAESKQYTFYEN